MNIRAGVLASLLLLAMPLFAREKSDVIVMNNGDRFTGEIKGLDSGVLYVSVDYIDGTSSVQWSKVHHLESQQLFVIRTEDGSVYRGTIKTAEGSADRPVSIEIFESSERAEMVGKSAIVRMNQTSDRFWQRFNGEINLGFMFSKGNESTQYSLSSSVEYPRERWGAGAKLDSSFSSSSGSSASMRNYLSLNALRLLRWKKWYYSGVASILQSSEQDIEFQTNLGGGIGHYLKNSNHATISVLAGLALQNTTYSNSVDLQRNQKVTLAMVSTNVKLFKFKKTSVAISGTAFPALSEPGRAFFNTDVSSSVKLFRDLTWNVSFYGNWDNRPPAHLSGSDYGTSSGFGWTFGNK